MFRKHLNLHIREMPVKQTMKQDYSGSDRHGNIKKQKNHGGVSLASKSIRIY
jgi:hypothetical protein